VVIVGAGFGGLRAARPGRRAVHVTLVDRRNYHLFQPLLYQVATSMPRREHRHRCAILRRQKNLDFRLAHVDAVDFDKRESRPRPARSAGTGW
jgi:NADH dehydrogenase